MKIQRKWCNFARKEGQSFKEKEERKVISDI